MREIKPYEMEYHDLAELCAGIEKILERQRIGTGLHDIASPIASYVNDFTMMCANSHYAKELNEINTERKTIAKEILAEINAKIQEVKL